MSYPKISALALAVSTVLSGSAYAGHEIASDGKQQIIEQPAGPAVGGDVSAGYWSKYIFRGTNLTPDSDGLVWAQAYLTVHPWENGTFTFGVWVGSQQGSAQVGGAERIGEAGGGAVPGSIGSRVGPGSSISAGSNDPVVIAAANALDKAFQKDFNNPNGITGDDFVSYMRDEFQILGVPPGSIQNTRDGRGLTNNALTNQDMRDLVRAATGKGIPNQITRIASTNETIQDRFTEIDATVEYRHDFGPIEVAIGNIFFYIDRESKSIATIREFFASDTAREFINNINFDRARVGGNQFNAPVIVVRPGHPEDFLANQGKTIKFKRRSTGDEMFDRGYIDLSTNLLTSYYGLKPHLTYYQTFMNEGEEGDSDLQTHRYDTRGGYVDFKIAASVPLWKENAPAAANDYKGDYKNSKATVGEEKVKLSFDPSFRVSYSVRDRAAEDGTPLTGFNHLQAAAQLTWHVSDNFSIVPEINYARHLGAPTLGTDRDEWWGGGRVEFRF